MIKLISCKMENVDIKISYTPDVRTYNIVSGMMSDDCKPFRIAQSVMIWITQNGYIGEIESIYPIIVNEPLCPFGKQIRHREGFPAFEVVSCDNEAYIQNNENGFTIWLDKGKIIDSEIVFNNLSFLISSNELVGIVCRKHMIT